MMWHWHVTTWRQKVTVWRNVWTWPLRPRRRSNMFDNNGLNSRGESDTGGRFRRVFGHWSGGLWCASAPRPTSSRIPGSSTSSRDSEIGWHRGCSTSGRGFFEGQVDVIRDLIRFDFISLFVFVWEWKSEIWRPQQMTKSGIPVSVIPEQQPFASQRRGFSRTWVGHFRGKSVVLFLQLDISWKVFILSLMLTPTIPCISGIIIFNLTKITEMIILGPFWPFLKLIFITSHIKQETFLKQLVP